jgi:biopolymer transport protein ExbD
MAMTAGASSGGVQSDINVTPMIDVLLVLLIIFMITQPLSRMAMDIQVPPPDTPQTNQTPPNQIVLELGDNGSFTINGQPVPKDQLDTQIHAIYDQRPAKLLFIKAGPNRLYQDVVEAMDVARGAGAHIIGLTPQEANNQTSPGHGQSLHPCGGRSSAPVRASGRDGPGRGGGPQVGPRARVRPGPPWPGAAVLGACTCLRPGRLSAGGRCRGRGPAARYLPPVRCPPTPPRPPRACPPLLT